MSPLSWPNGSSTIHATQKAPQKSVPIAQKKEQEGGGGGIKIPNSYCPFSGSTLTKKKKKGKRGVWAKASGQSGEKSNLRGH